MLAKLYFFFSKPWEKSFFFIELYSLLSISNSIEYTKVVFISVIPILTPFSRIKTTLAILSLSILLYPHPITKCWQFFKCLFLVLSVFVLMFYVHALTFASKFILLFFYYASIFHFQLPILCSIQMTYRPNKPICLEHVPTLTQFSPSTPPLSELHSAVISHYWTIFHYVSLGYLKAS